MHVHCSQRGSGSTEQRQHLIRPGFIPSLSIAPTTDSGRIVQRVTQLLSHHSPLTAMGGLEKMTGVPIQSAGD